MKMVLSEALRWPQNHIFMAIRRTSSSVKLPVQAARRDMFGSCRHATAGNISVIDLNIVWEM